LGNVVTMALDSTLPRGETFAAQPENGEEMGETSWTSTRLFDVGYGGLSRSSRTSFAALGATRTVTLWDEALPERPAWRDADDDSSDA
jgi:hypothetical protein